MPACTGIVELRRARPADARAIAQVHVETWQHAYRQLLPASFLDTLDVDRRGQFWESELEVTPAERRPWIAAVDGRLVGFVSSGPCRDPDALSDSGEVYAIYVLPDCWDRGVGRDLLRHAERDLCEHGYSTATLWVLAENQRARRFYEAAGWTADANRTESIGGTALEEVRYRRAIGPAAPRARSGVARKAAT